MKLNMTNLVPAIVCAIMFAAIIVVVRDYPQEGKQLLLIASSLGLLLAAILVVRELRAKKAKDRSEEEKKATESKRGVPLNKFLTTSAWIVGIVPLVYLVGFTIGSSLYAFIYYKLHGGRWLPSIGLAIIMAAVIYFGFIVGLRTIFPRPILLPFFRG